MPDDTFLPRAAQNTERRAPAWAKKSPPKSKAAVRACAKTTWRKALAPRDPHEHARKIAENAIDAWYQSYGGSSIDIPIGTIAALALLRQPEEIGNGLADWILSRQPHELPQLFKEIYLGYWIKRPDLINRALRLHDWAWNPDPDPQQLRAVQAVTHRALNQGLLDLTGHDDPGQRAEADVLSPLLTGLRHKSDKKWRGEYHTPACVTDLMANMLVDKDFAQPGLAIREPAVGSGTMFRSVAQRLRDLGLNPHDYHWYGNDIDSLSAGCAAVNTIIWDLGPNAFIGCADSLATEDSGYAKTLSEAKDAFEQRDRYVDTATAIVTSRRAFRLLDELTSSKETAAV
ncbi:N-6 DNA methylase [Streptantibioticus ferralitis]|uniref:N-6 DNA methylase n=1 Tax=Streptantibioticus ferralitis TaxID=236510 RepID=A0ABT5YZZ5_9ACTN|nr:N-6 DNA methylase [Streptantibioticus ferralitis]MDF2257155.1 N-6 DNA methylase [Streptantibioticus ferralitis]